MADQLHRRASTFFPGSAEVPRFAVLDVETTGLDPERDRVLELAILRADEHGLVLDQWTSRFHPEGPG